MTEEKQNAKQAPAVYYCRHMFAGIVGYENERILVDTDAMKGMAPSMVGKPVYALHQDVDLEKLQETAAGYVTDCFYNELDGWLWAKFIIVSDEGHKAIADEWSVSNAYVPTQWAIGGTFHNIDYNRRIAGGEFTHLALVPNPRYESACIFTPDQFKVYQAGKKSELLELQNSKPTNGVSKMFKFFKNEKKEVSQADSDTMVELENGESASIGDMIGAYLNAKAKKNEDEKAEEAKEAPEAEKMNMDQEIAVGEETMPLKELINKYMALSNKKNAEVEAEEMVEETENESDEDKKEEKEEEKTNAADQVDYIAEVLNASDKKAAARFIDTSLDQVARGKATYGSNK